MKLWNTKICLTSTTTIVFIIGALFSTIVLANILSEETIEVEEIVITEELAEEQDVWVPTEEDIAYQDSMYSIIQNTQEDITDIKEDIEHIFDRLDYEDGTHDSVRYIKDGPIDKRRN